MTKPCPERERVQLLLDGELEAEPAESLRRHLAECAECAAEQAAYLRLYSMLERLPELEAPFGLRAEILDRVLPSRVRMRWIRAIGWAYAGATAVVTFAALTAVSRAEVRELLQEWAGDASLGVARLLVVSLNQLAVGLAHLPDLIGLVDRSGVRLLPLGRALEHSLALPTVQASLWAAGLVSLALFNWMRARDGRSRKGGSHGRVILA